MPVMTVAMAYFIEGQVPTSSVVASLVVLSSGVAICVWQGQASGTLFSILLCTLSTLVRPASSAILLCTLPSSCAR
jgi:drug/metabolite transporter (DMT)-like permease